MKKYIALIAIAALTGCVAGPYGQTYVDPAGAAVVGGVVGYAIGASQSRPVYVQPRPYYAPRPYYGPRSYYGPSPYYRRGW